MIHKRTKYFSLFILLLLIGGTLVLCETLQASDWKIGRVTAVSEHSIKIDGRGHAVSQAVIIRDTGKEILPSDLDLLRGVDKILYRTQEGKIVEIRIFTRKH
jgi:hypothetical protein